MVANTAMKTITASQIAPCEIYSITVDIAPGSASIGIPHGITPYISFSTDSCVSFSVDFVPSVVPYNMLNAIISSSNPLESYLALPIVEEDMWLF